MPRRPSGYAYETKWDGFRAMVRTQQGFRVLSRRRWYELEREAVFERASRRARSSAMS